MQDDLELQTPDGWIVAGKLGSEPLSDGPGASKAQPACLSLVVAAETLQLVRELAGRGTPARWRGQVGAVRQRFTARVVSVDVGLGMAQIELIGGFRNEDAGSAVPRWILDSRGRG
jgi:hypothetical protein